MKGPLRASLLAIGAGVAWSFGALSVRLARHTDAWQYLFWRSIGIIVVIEMPGRVRRASGPARSMLVRSFTSGRTMLVAHLTLLLASLAYVYAVKTTTAANAAFLSSVTPLTAVVLARVFLRERLTRVTGGAIIVALLGLAVMVSADVAIGNVTGNISALLSSVGFAGYTVCVRSDRTRDWLPVLPGYASLLMVLCAIVTVSRHHTLLPPARDISLALFHGAVLIVVGTMAFNAATRGVPAVAMTVYAQSETVFAPFWVFLVLGEAPSGRTMLGGALILFAVLGKAVLDGRVATGLSLQLVSDPELPCPL